MGQLNNFAKVVRAKLTPLDNAVRCVYKTILIENIENYNLASYVSDRAPYYYRKMSDFIESIEDGLFITSIKETLLRLPTSDKFKESHFGEMLSSIFIEDIMQLKIIYSKLALLTSQNANAFKMDLILYNPKSNPLEIIMGEVKSSPKNVPPANHNRSIFPDLFTSFNQYQEDDLQFDLAAAKDQLKGKDPEEIKRIRSALLPYSDKIIKYAGFVVIDNSTYEIDEVRLLQTRQNNKDFDVDIICVESYQNVAHSTYGILSKLREACLP